MIRYLENSNNDGKQIFLVLNAGIGLDGNQRYVVVTQPGSTTDEENGKTVAPGIVGGWDSSMFNRSHPVVGRRPLRSQYAEDLARRMREGEKTE